MAPPEVERTRRLYRRFAPFYDAFRAIWSRLTRPVFLTAPRRALLRALLRALGGPFSYRLVDPAPILGLAGLDESSRCAGGIATLAVFRASAEVPRDLDAAEASPA